MVEQRARRRETLAAGATHVGWKLGTGDRDRIGGSISVGYITSASCLEPGGRYLVDGTFADLRADVELAVELGEGGAIAGYATALEVCDVSPVLHDAAAVVAANIFHRAVAFGPMRQSLPAVQLRAWLCVDGSLAGSDDTCPDLAALLADVADVLDHAELALEQGDRILTGNIVQIPVTPGTRVEAAIEGLGAVALDVQ